MRALADSVAVEVEASIATPIVTAPVDVPARTGFASAQHDVAPVVDDLVAAERIRFGARKDRHRRVVRAKGVVSELIAGRSGEQQTAGVLDNPVAGDRR